MSLTQRSAVRSWKTHPATLRPEDSARRLYDVVCIHIYKVPVGNRKSKIWTLSIHCSPNSLLLGFYLRKKRAGHTPWPRPELCGWALCPGLVLLLSSMAGLCSVSRPCPLLVLCGWALWLGSVSRPCPPLVLLLSSVAGLCGWALCPGLVLLLSSVAGLCGWALCPGLVLLLSFVAGSCPPLVLFFSSSCPCFGRAPELCGWALWPGSVSRSCPPLVLALAAPLNSVAGLCGPAYWRGVWPNR